MAKSQSKPPGCIYANNGRLWWRGKLPGEDKQKYRPIRPPGARHALLDSPDNRKAAVYIVRNWWETAARKHSGGKVTTVSDLVAAYIAHAQIYYRRQDGTLTGEAKRIIWGIRLVSEHYGSLPADAVTQTEIKAIRQKMIDDNLARTTINAKINIVKRMYYWAADEQIVPPSTWHAVQVVRNLQRGRSGARETAIVRPIDEKQVRAVLPYMPATLQSMVQLQLLTGMRSTEVCLLRPQNIDRSGTVWIYRPEQHKTEHLGHTRHVAIGPQSQKILRPFLERKPDQYCFTPDDSMAQRGRSRQAMRPLYDRRTYYRAIWYAIKTARRDGLQVECWGPHRLRHTFLTNIRKHFDIETARIAGGHSNMSSTEIYAERDLARAEEVARQLG